MASIETMVGLSCHERISATKFHYVSHRQNVKRGFVKKKRHKHHKLLYKQKKSFQAHVMTKKRNIKQVAKCVTAM